MDIKFVTLTAEKQEIYRFRYRIYVEELQRPQHYADHSQKTVIEPLDTSGYLLAAYDAKGDIVGTVRINYVRDGNLSYYPQLYRLNVTDKNFSDTSITTKFMVSAKYRKSSQLAKLMVLECYKRAVITDGIKVDIIDVNDGLIKFFQHLGYRLQDVINHPEYGAVNLMRLDAYDISHLTAVKSPFCNVLTSHLFKSNDFFEGEGDGLYEKLVGRVFTDIKDFPRNPLYAEGDEGPDHGGTL
jgi:hypothetical protein